MCPLEYFVLVKTQLLLPSGFLPMGLWESDLLPLKKFERIQEIPIKYVEIFIRFCIQDGA